MVERYPELWTVPEIAKATRSYRPRLSKIAEHWDLGTVIDGKRFLLKAEAEALAWLGENPRYDGPPPWPSFKPFELKRANEKDMKLLRKYNLGVRIGGMVLVFAKDMKRLRHVRATGGRGIYDWVGSVRPKKTRLDTSRFPQYNASQGVVRKTSTVPARSPEERKRNNMRPKSDKERFAISAYVTKEMKARLETEIEKRPWLSISALVAEIISKHYEGENNG